MQKAATHNTYIGIIRLKYFFVALKVTDMPSLSSDDMSLYNLFTDAFPMPASSNVIYVNICVIVVAIPFTSDPNDISMNLGKIILMAKMSN